MWLSNVVFKTCLCTLCILFPFSLSLHFGIFYVVCSFFFISRSRMIWIPVSFWQFERVIITFSAKSLKMNRCVLCICVPQWMMGNALCSRIKKQQQREKKKKTIVKKRKWTLSIYLVATWQFDHDKEKIIQPP